MPLSQLNPLGVQLVDSGKQQTAMGTKLAGTSTQMRNVAKRLKAGGQIDQSLASIRTGTNSIRLLLGPVVTALQHVANALNAVTVPTVSRQTRTVNIPAIGNITVVTGVTIGSTKPLAAAATRVTTIRDQVNDIRDMLATIRDGVGDVRAELPAVRGEINKTADEVKLAGANVTASGKAMIKAGTLISGS